jgi:Fe-S-cluster-containing dehydrogenase component
VNNPKKAKLRVISLYPHPVIKKPVVCSQCKIPKCAENCPTGAIYATPEGIVRIDEKTCVSCQMCVTSCPFGAIFLHPDIDIPFKCDLCNGKPKCVEVCPKKAIIYTPEHILGQSQRLVSVLKYAHMREVEYFEHGIVKKLKYADIEKGKREENNDT